MKGEKNTLVILAPGFASSEDDSTCLPMQQSFVRWWKKIYPGTDIVILAFQYPYREDEYSIAGARVISFGGRNRGGWSRLLLRRKIYARLETIRRSSRLFGLLSFWYGECALVGSRFAAMHGLPHRCWLLGQDARAGNAYVTKLKLREQELVALSDSLRKEFEKNHAQIPQYMVPSGIEPLSFSVNENQRDVDLMAAGSLIPLKQFQEFLRLVAVLRQHHPGISAILAGDGPERQPLENLSAALGLQDHVRFTGEIAHGEVLQWMGRTKVFIHPSSYEGFSGVCQEALAAGSQVVSVCRAMNEEIPHWHLVSSFEEMCSRAQHLLQKEDLSHEAVIPFRMEDTVRSMAAVFT